MPLQTICRLAFFCLLIAPSAPSTAQQIAEDDKQAAIQSIANNIAIHYLDLEKGGQIASYILTRYHDGEFSKAGDWKQFDEQVSKSLFNYSKDGHLYVRYSPEIVRGLNNSGDQNNLNAGDRHFANYGFTETSVIEGNVGYLKISAINLSKESLPVLEKCMAQVKDTKALIIDLRDNGGGGSEVGSVLESYFLPAGTPLLELRSRDGSVHTETTVDWLKDKMYDKPVYIIINKKTASAAEAFAFSLQQNKRAVIVGERSAGAANMTEWFAVNDNNYISVSTASPTFPGRKTTWEQKGIIPDIKIKSDDPVGETLGKINKK
jgi:hypothetical protein